MLPRDFLKGWGELSILVDQTSIGARRADGSNSRIERGTETAWLGVRPGLIVGGRWQFVAVIDPNESYRGTTYVVSGTDLGAAISVRVNVLSTSSGLLPALALAFTLD